MDFDGSLLLSEVQAAYQASQRSMAQIQERLAAMVLQHGKAQVGPGQNQADAPTQTAAESSDSWGPADAGERYELGY